MLYIISSSLYIVIIISVLSLDVLSIVVAALCFVDNHNSYIMFKKKWIMLILGFYNNNYFYYYSAGIDYYFYE